MPKFQDPSSKKRKIQDSKPAKTRKAAPVQDASVSAVVVPVSSFEELSLPGFLQKAISDLGATALSPLQRQAIPALIAGKDLAAVSAPGRDAILSFLLPAVSLLDQHRFHTRHGTGVLIVTSSRESAIQISGLASELLAGTTYTTGMIMEGANRGAEEQKLDRGINLLIATPTRLLEHMRDTTSFVFKNLKAFCVYGADGFAADMQLREILTQLPKKPRVSVVLAGQAIEGLEGLVELVCRPDSLHRYVESDVRAGGSKETQGYVVVEADKRFLLLYSFLKKFQQKKIVVVAGSTQGALFAADMLSALDLEVHTLHGRQNVKTRTAAFSGYVNDAEGTLICTEEAVQGLQIPPVDWIIQYDPPRTSRDFLRQRGMIKGRPVMFLQPTELAFIEVLKAAEVPVEEFDFPKKKLINVQAQIEKFVSKEFELHVIAKDAFRSFLQEYNHHAESNIFDTTVLDLKKVGKSFGFDTPPRVEVKTVVEVKVDKNLRTYGPERPRDGKKRKAL